MKENLGSRKVIVKGREVFIGVDVHKVSWHVRARAGGEEIFNSGIPGTYQALRGLLDQFKDCRVRVAYEAGPCGFWLHDKLSEEGIEVMVVPPSLIPVESGNKVKTDKRDSRKLARLLESGLLKKVYVLTEEDRADRELLRTRRQVLEHRSDVARQIKSKLLFHGIASPFSTKTWTQGYLRWLRDLTFEREALRISFDFLIELYEYLTTQLIQLRERIVELSRSDKYRHKLNLLKSVPGIGTLIAMEILVELSDIERFARADELASSIGLTPWEFSTGEYVRQGRITRCGNKRVRTCLVEASWILIQKDPWMRSKYGRLKGIKGGKRAIIAIARNLIIRIRRLLLNNEPYVVGVC